MQVFRKQNQPLFLNETLMKKRKFNKNGFSIIEVLSASAIASIIAISSAMLVAQGRSVATFGEFHAALEQKHNLALHKVRNATRLSIQTDFNLYKDNPCFKQVRDATNACDSAGKDWHSFTVDPVPFKKEDGTGAISTEDTGISADHLLDYSIKYKYICTPSSCTEMQIFVETKPTATAVTRGLVAKTRFTQFTIPFILMSNKDDIKFNCAAASVVTSIDYYQLRAVCTPTAQAFCGNLPIAGGASACQVGSAQSDCPNNRGVRIAGLVQNQTNCNP